MEEFYEMKSAFRWKTSEFWLQTGMSGLLVLIIAVSGFLCGGTLRFAELFSGFEAMWVKIGAEIGFALLVTIYFEFVYRIVFANWTYRYGVETLFALSAFVLFLLLGLIAFILFEWNALAQWWNNDFGVLSLIPVQVAAVFFFVYVIRRILYA